MWHKYATCVTRAATRMAAPQQVWRRAEVTFWTGNFHFTDLLLLDNANNTLTFLTISYLISDTGFLLIQTCQVFTFNLHPQELPKVESLDGFSQSLPCCQIT